MSNFDYSAYFGPILPLADVTRSDGERCWEIGTEKDKVRHDYVLYLGCNVLRTVALAETITAILSAMEFDFVALADRRRAVASSITPTAISRRRKN